MLYAKHVEHFFFRVDFLKHVISGFSASGVKFFAFNENSGELEVLSHVKFDLKKLPCGQMFEDIFQGNNPLQITFMLQNLHINPLK